MEFRVFTQEELNSGEYHRTVSKLNIVSEERYGKFILVGYAI